MANQVIYSTIVLILLTEAAEKEALVKREMKTADAVLNLSPEAEAELRHDELPHHQLAQDIRQRVTKIKKRKIRKTPTKTSSPEALDKEFPIT